jgi:hypothetical protein
MSLIALLLTLRAALSPVLSAVPTTVPLAAL